MLRLVIFTGLVLSNLFLNGCMLGMIETADIVPKGKIECGTSLRYAYYSEGNYEPGYNFFFQVIPKFYLKYGVSEKLDLGVTFPGQAATLGLLAKYQMFDFVIDGAVSIDLSYNFTEEGYLSIAPRFILSNENPGTIPFAFNIGFSYDDGGGARENDSFAVFTAIGVPLFLTKNRRIRIMPEISYVHVIKMNRVFLGEFAELPFYEGLRNRFHFGIVVSFLAE